MKKLLFVISILFISYSCSSLLMMGGTKYKYNYKLIEPVASENMTFEDEKVQAIFAIGAKSISFNLKNKTNDAIKIVWDNASIIKYGEAKKIMHAGIKYIDRNGPQLATSIPPKASIDDIAMPTENIYYTSGQYGGWNEHDLFLSTDLNNEEYKALILSNKGKTFSLFLPLEINKETVNYNFVFEITDVSAVVNN